MTMTEKRIQTALPEGTYEDALYASSLYGMTMKSFAAAAIAEKTYDILDAMRNRRNQVKRLHMNPKELAYFNYLMEHPEEFDEARKRFKELAKTIGLVSVPEDEER